MIRRYFDTRRLNFLSVECGTPLRGTLRRKIENQAVLNATLVLLNRIFRLTKLVILKAPKVVLNREFEMIDEAITTLRIQPLDGRNDLKPAAAPTAVMAAPNRQSGSHA